MQRNKGYMKSHYMRRALSLMLTLSMVFAGGTPVSASSVRDIPEILEAESGGVLSYEINEADTPGESRGECNGDNLENAGDGLSGNSGTLSGGSASGNGGAAGGGRASGNDGAAGGGSASGNSGAAGGGNGSGNPGAAGGGNASGNGSAAGSETAGKETSGNSVSAPGVPVSHNYAAELKVGECRFLEVSGCSVKNGYTFEVSDNSVLSINKNGRWKGLSYDKKKGYSETLVTAIKDGTRHEMWIKINPPMCINSSTVGAPGAKWDIKGVFIEASGEVRYRSLDKKTLKIGKDGIAKGKKSGTTEVVKEIKSGNKWVEVDRESFTIYKPHIKSEKTASRTNPNGLSGNDIIIASELIPNGFKSSRKKILTVEGDKFLLNKQGMVTVYTQYGTASKTLKKYRTRVTVIGRT